ncbi:hypothetical protein C0Q70_02140 [Pomacea canaliculata]|uniref:Peptidase S1 domain-containing protein n=1 Tax=Pomacea canaliculata TaxID=400727 RepID=A0A2T7Q1H4_POMCA|nr:hypothetical protein C0Q70_02140 [Pomacea canaliculata]
MSTVGVAAVAASIPLELSGSAIDQWKIDAEGCGKRNPPYTRDAEHYVVGGSEASPYTYPFICALYYGTSQICGGSLIRNLAGNYWFVTAAHCVDSSTIKNDIALFRLSQTGFPRERISAVCIPTQDYREGENSTVLGWGTLREGGSSSSLLQVASKPVVSDTTCRTAYGSSFDANSMVCAGVYPTGGIDACQGDSGGPLVAERNGELQLIGKKEAIKRCKSACLWSTYVRTKTTHGDKLLKLIHPYLQVPCLLLSEEPKEQCALYYGSSQICGGSLIRNLAGNYWFVTAAHCVSGTLSSFSIRCGVHNLQSSSQPFEFKPTIQARIIHESYSSASLKNDIALFRLSQTGFPRDRIGAVCIPTQDYVAGENSTVIGWGLLREGGSSSSTLQQASKPIVSDATCRTAYGSSFDANTMVCAGVYPTGGIDACQGDSGGPLVVQRNGELHLVGITSFGWGCGRPQLPGVYADVTKLKSWINSKINSWAPEAPGTMSS